LIYDLRFTIHDLRFCARAQFFINHGWARIFVLEFVFIRRRIFSDPLFKMIKNKKWLAVFSLRAAMLFNGGCFVPKLAPDVKMQKILNARAPVPGGCCWTFTRRKILRTSCQSLSGFSAAANAELEGDAGGNLNFSSRVQCICAM
jgi:hypothetical protein